MPNSIEDGNEPYICFRLVIEMFENVFTVHYSEAEDDVRLAV